MGFRSTSQVLSREHLSLCRTTESSPRPKRPASDITLLAGERPHMGEVTRSHPNKAARGGSEAARLRPAGAGGWRGEGQQLPCGSVEHIVGRDVHDGDVSRS